MQPYVTRHGILITPVNTEAPFGVGDIIRRHSMELRVFSVRYDGARDGWEIMGEETNGFSCLVLDFLPREAHYMVSVL